MSSALNRWWTCSQHGNWYSPDPKCSVCGQEGKEIKQSWNPPRKSPPWKPHDNGTTEAELTEVTQSANARRATIREEKLRQKTLGQLSPTERHVALVKEILEIFSSRGVGRNEQVEFLCKYFNVVDLTLIKEDLRNG